MKPLLKQKGFAAIAAIFLVVILAALGAYMLTFSNTQQFTATQDLQGSRGYWAARAGLEWGIGSFAASGTSPPTCPASTILAPSFDGGFTVQVTGFASNYTEASATPNRYLCKITSVATSAGAVGSINYTQRSLTATIER